ncbi:MAG: MBL fold metallo-hydrolase [Bacilli bacterium]|nr:MBL fold metallo-hydrolase [Bacilli bacterium]
MKIEKFSYNDIDDLFANTYVVSDSFSNAIVIDPSVDNDGIIKYLESRNLLLKGVLLTHGHFDHMRGVNRLIEKYHIPLYIHEFDYDNLTNTYLNCSYGENKEVVIKSESKLLKDNDELQLLKEDTIKVIHTPFHTKGSVCYYLLNNKILFSGDTLFKNSIGRDDLPGAIANKREESLSKLKRLPIETKIYPGHGANSTIGNELALNYFLRK